LTQNKFRREVFFTTAFMEESRLSLTDYLEHLGIVDKLTLTKSNPLNLNQYKQTMTGLLQLSGVVNQNSPDELNFYNYFRFGVLARADGFLKKGEKNKARALMRMLDTYGSDAVIPYQNEAAKNYVATLREKSK